jgi:putative transposase
VQQFRDACPWGELPRYLLRDRDHAFDHVETIGIQEVLTAPRAPWQNAYVERFIGSIRRECLDHVIVLSAAGLQRVLKDYVAYYMRSRTHLSLDKDSPTPRPVMPPTAGRIVAAPEVNGLHHRYGRAAACASDANVS